ncbi:type IV toxin-antitoxin system AbiEi family antitoxin domain-containing protein [Nocardioides aestuarii]|uniref:Type IV toxin-antitoxin system AbiEi family antitoxin domain-containing protein n=1 Tax=Nocardioides aestuarii TaxID=252231 RepID=A0ABW4TQ41_9ACTN
MLHRVRPHLARQRGLITRSQLVYAGLTPLEIRRLLRTGSLVRIQYGVYADGDLWQELDPWRGRPLLAARAATYVLRCDGYAFSHDSAALAWKLPLPDARTALTHVSRRKVHGDAVRNGVKHHLAPFGTDQVRHLEGLRVLDLPRTALDLGREHGLLACVAACDAVLSRGVTRRRLSETLARMWCWPQSTVMREAIELADGGAESWLESEGRLFVIGLGIGRPRTQLGLTDGSRTVFVDAIVGRHVFEFDGAVKYTADNPSGRPPAEVLREEKVRQDFISGFKLGVSRVTAHDCRAGRAAAERRVMREYVDTCHRFGTDRSDLAPYVVTAAADGLRRRL